MTKTRIFLKSVDMITYQVSTTVNDDIHSHISPDVVWITPMSMHYASSHSISDAIMNILYDLRGRNV